MDFGLISMPMMEEAGQLSYTVQNGLRKTLLSFDAFPQAFTFDDVEHAVCYP